MVVWITSLMCSPVSPVCNYLSLAPSSSASSFGFVSKQNRFVASSATAKQTPFGKRSALVATACVLLLDKTILTSSALFSSTTGSSSSATSTTNNQNDDDDDDDDNDQYDPMKMSETECRDHSDNGSSGGTNRNSKMNYLEQARSLSAPVPNSTMYGEDESADFWEAHASLIRRAWNQWETQQQEKQSFDGENDELPKLAKLSRQHIDPRLRVAVESAWNSGHQASTATTSGSVDDKSWALQQLQQDEDRLRQLWKPVVPESSSSSDPAVYACQFLDASKLHEIRQYLDSMDASGIPTRRPNGMNRYGYILDPTIDGAANMTELTRFYQYLVQEYIRPLARLFFTSYVGNHGEDDMESYAFTVRYKEGEDLSLAEHSDASLYTLNVNLNPPPKPNTDLTTNNSPSYEGSTLYFVEEEEGGGNKGKNRRKEHNVTFQPGMALLHRGMTRHAALPITKGERTNLIIWVYGKHGYVRIAPYTNANEQFTPIQRWNPRNKNKNPNSMIHSNSNDNGKTPEKGDDNNDDDDDNDG